MQLGAQAVAQADDFEGVREVLGCAGQNNVTPCHS
jgi:hypothetical protein